MRLVPIDGEHGKLKPDALECAARAAVGHGVHSYKPTALSLTQATEGGTVYSIDEVRALCDSARTLGLKTHMDGARFIFGHSTSDEDVEALLAALRGSK